jgi:hypothetical protein
MKDKLGREIKKTFGKELTAGRACALPYGFTQQDAGTSSFLLREVNRRTNFSKSLTGRSSEILAASPVPE